MPALAQEPPPACPTEPPDYAPTGDPDPTIAEFRQLRQELARACAAQLAELAKVDATAGEPVELAPGTQVGIAGNVELAEPVTVDGEVRAEVTNPGEATDIAPVVETVELAGEAQRSAVWFLAGLLTVLIAAVVMVREFRA